MAEKNISYELAHSLLTYEPETGLFRWKVDRTNNANAGDVAGSEQKGYISLCLKRNFVMAHRLAWMITYGAFPDPILVIDHINQDKLDNRLSNLRVITERENSNNVIKPRKDNVLGIRGVQQRSQNSFRASFCTPDGKKHFLGPFKTAIEASNAYWEAKHHHFPGLIREAA